MKNILDVNWKKGMSFETEINGHKLTIDAGIENGGDDKGPRPKALMLLSLAGCTGMDVISILKKMRVEPDNFNVEVDADMTEEHPKHYNKMHVIYKFWGENLPIDKIEKAVSLSNERYCGVYAVYKKAMEITYEIKINPEN
ncbi:MAG: OsmC family protein [Bacteroidales bacterium]|nr:OsmC family protein [Bacteroidales bacterium]